MQQDTSSTTIVFLDIDGVLNNMARFQWLHENFMPGSGGDTHWDIPDDQLLQEHVGWDPKNTEALGFLLNETNANLVISSTWRIFVRIPRMRTFFRLFGLDGKRIIGQTPRVQHIGAIRGDEVNEWLKVSNRVDRFVCIDDDSDFYPDQNLVQTNIDLGLTMEDAQRAIDILKG